MITKTNYANKKQLLFAIKDHIQYLLYDEIQFIFKHAKHIEYVRLTKNNLFDVHIIFCNDIINYYNSKFQLRLFNLEVLPSNNMVKCWCNFDNSYLDFKFPICTYCDK